MQEILELLNSENYIIFLTALVFVLIIILLIVTINSIRTKKQYNKFIKKLGNGNNIQEDLEQFINRVEKVEINNKKLMAYCNKLDKDISKCIQKVGIVRYSAFRDAGSDLSFAVALLDDENNGVVFNGIYSTEMSTIYSKPIQNGTSKYTLSQEELEAIKRAIESNDYRN